MLENTQIRDAFYNAYVNANRKKNSKFEPLYKKKNEKVDKEYNENAIEIIREIEETEGKSWVDKLYSSIGMKRPVKR